MGSEMCIRDRGALIGKTTYKQTLALNEMAVFARSGVTIPLSKEVEYTDQFFQEDQMTSHEIPITAYWKAGPKK